MEPGPLGDLIPTEQLHPLLLAMVLAVGPVLTVLLIPLWLLVLLPLIGGHFGVALIVTNVVSFALLDLWAYTQIQPSGVRVGPDGIVVERRFSAPFRFPGDRLVLEPRSPAGFGVVRLPNGPGFPLSPAQFAAAKRFFPVRDSRDA